MRWKELSLKLRDRIVSGHRSGDVYHNISGALKNTVASIILKWKKALPRAGHLVKLSNKGRRALSRAVTNNPMVTLTEIQSSSVEMGEPSRSTPISAALYQSGLCGSGQTEATPQ